MSLVFVKAQNKLGFQYYTGLSRQFVSYPNSSSSLGDFNVPFYGRIDFFDKFRIANTISLSYETGEFILLNKKYFLMIEGNLSHRYYYSSLHQFSLQNIIYLPLQNKEKRVRPLLGIKNSFLFGQQKGDRLSENDFFVKNNYNFGLVYLCNFKLSEKVIIGLHFYHDISALIIGYGTASTNLGQAAIIPISHHMNYEIMLRLSYQLKKYKN